MPSHTISINLIQNIKRNKSPEYIMLDDYDQAIQNTRAIDFMLQNALLKNHTTMAIGQDKLTIELATVFSNVFLSPSCKIKQVILWDGDVEAMRLVVKTLQKPSCQLEKLSLYKLNDEACKAITSTLLQPSGNLKKLILEKLAPSAMHILAPTLANPQCSINTLYLKKLSNEACSVLYQALQQSSKKYIFSDLSDIENKWRHCFQSLSLINPRNPRNKPSADLPPVTATNTSPSASEEHMDRVKNQPTPRALSQNTASLGFYAKKLQTFLYALEGKENPEALILDQFSDDEGHDAGNIKHLGALLKNIFLQFPKDSQLVLNNPDKIMTDLWVSTMESLMDADCRLFTLKLQHISQASADKISTILRNPSCSIRVIDLYQLSTSVCDIFLGAIKVNPGKYCFKYRGIPKNIGHQFFKFGRPRLKAADRLSEVSANVNSTQPPAVTETSPPHDKKRKHETARGYQPQSSSRLDPTRNPTEPSPTSPPHDYHKKRRLDETASFSPFASQSHAADNTAWHSSHPTANPFQSSDQLARDIAWLKDQSAQQGQSIALLAAQNKQKDLTIALLEIEKQKLIADNDRLEKYHLRLSAMPQAYSHAATPPASPLTLAPSSNASSIDLGYSTGYATLSQPPSFAPYHGHAHLANTVPHQPCHYTQYPPSSSVTSAQPSSYYPTTHTYATPSAYLPQTANQPYYPRQPSAPVTPPVNNSAGADMENAQHHYQSPPSLLEPSLAHRASQPS